MTGAFGSGHVRARDDGGLGFDRSGWSPRVVALVPWANRNKPFAVDKETTAPFRNTVKMRRRVALFDPSMRGHARYRFQLCTFDMLFERKKNTLHTKSWGTCHEFLLYILIWPRVCSKCKVHPGCCGLCETRSVTLYSNQMSKLLRTAMFD